jgi:hypothetical protein
MAAATTWILSRGAGEWAGSIMRMMRMCSIISSLLLIHTGYSRGLAEFSLGGGVEGGVAEDLEQILQAHG